MSLFASCHQALLFAYTFAANEHGEAAAAERQIALFARSRYPDPPSSGRGLTGLDGAAQAAMIQSIVERAGAHAQLVCLARFGRLNARAVRIACLALAVAYRTETDRCAAHVDARADRLLERHYGVRRAAVQELADQYDVELRSVRRWQREVRRWIVATERRVMDGLEQDLERAGVIDRQAN